MSSKLDCRGLACPTPVLQTKELIEKEHPSLVKVTVDNEAAGENVSRFLGTQQFEVILEKNGKDLIVIGRRGEVAEAETVTTENHESEKKKIMVMIATDRVGYGDDELGLKLMVNFFR